MRVKLSFVAITVAALSVVSCNESSARPADPCKVASKLPAYEVTQRDGSVVGVPSGRVLVRDASMEGLNGPALSRACRAFVRQYESDHR